MKKLIIANWKMTPDSAKEAAELFNATEKAAKKARNAKVVICPPFVYLGLFSKNLKPKSYKLKPDLGAQDVFWENNGSYTGGISAKMLKNSGVKYVIIGHSERRRLGETDEMINKKIKAALKNKLNVVFCVGERERDEEGRYFYFVKDEITKGLEKIPSKFFKNLIVAYEPVWAISSGEKKGKARFHPDTPEDAYQMATYIKRLLVSMSGKVGRNVPILYGGSVDVKNAKDFLTKGNTDGLLVGRTSWNAKKFSELLKGIDKIILK